MSGPDFPYQTLCIGRFLWQDSRVPHGDLKWEIPVKKDGIITQSEEVDKEYDENRGIFIRKGDAEWQDDHLIPKRV